jgi:hypothetical protein
LDGWMDERIRVVNAAKSTRSIELAYCKKSGPLTRSQVESTAASYTGKSPTVTVAVTAAARGSSTVTEPCQSGAGGPAGHTAKT